MQHICHFLFRPPGQGSYGQIMHIYIKSNMAGNPNTRKINQHDINIVFVFLFALVKFRNVTAIEYIFSLE